MKNKGFTLIELLIVITLLGILAVAVLSAINPVEQMNRSRDTASRSDAEQLLSAIDRYYASTGYYPWFTAPPTDDESDHSLKCDGNKTFCKVDMNLTDGSQPSLTKLSSGGYAEIKESFVTRITDEGYNFLYVYNEGGQGDSTYVCFKPQSAAFREEAMKRCGISAEATPTPMVFRFFEFIKKAWAVPDDFPTEDACGETIYSCLP